MFNRFRDCCQSALAKIESGCALEDLFGESSEPDGEKMRNKKGRRNKKGKKNKKKDH